MQKASTDNADRHHATQALLALILHQLLRKSTVADKNDIKKELEHGSRLKMPRGSLLAKLEPELEHLLSQLG